MHTSMNPSRPDRARHILAAALDHHPADRDAFLITACDNDAALLAEVRMLLAAHEAMPTGFLAGSAVEGIVAGDLAVTIKHAPGTRAPIRPTAEQAGEMIGPYKLREQIGEGGFGTVWVAEQEQPVRRRVALKIIKLGMDTKEVIARFEQERQALAMMDHPNIAKVLDAGATQTGRPFFVMELVRGVKITDYCDEQQLSTRGAARAVHPRLPGGAARASERASSTATSSRRTSSSRSTTARRCRRSSTSAWPRRRRGGSPTARSTRSSSR